MNTALNSTNLGKVADFLGGVVSVLESSGATNTLLSKAEGVVNAAKQSDLKGALSSICGSVQGPIADDIDKLEAAVTSAVANGVTKQDAQNVYTSIIAVSGSVVKLFVDVHDGKFAAVPGDVVSVVEDIISLAQLIMTAAQKLYAEVSAILAPLADVAEAVFDAAVDKADDLIQMMHEKLQSMHGKMGGLPDKIDVYIQEQRKNIDDEFSTLVKDVKNLLGGSSVEASQVSACDDAYYHLEHVLVTPA